MLQFPLVAFIFVLLFSTLSTASAIAAGPAKTGEALLVRFPDVQHPYYAVRDQYYQKLLILALERSKISYKTEGILLPDYSEARSMAFIKEGRYDIHWLNTTPSREEQLRPVRIPLDKGAIGWRAFLIRPDQQDFFATLKTVEDLRQVTMGQGHDWADVEILMSNGFRVERSPSWAGLFKMVLLNRIQAFPRSILEIAAEQRQPEAAGLAIEKTLILRYPAAYYFFVSRENKALAAALQTGLETAIADGSFDQLFHEYYGPAIAALNMEKRTVLSIPNRTLQSQMPLDKPEFWFDVGAFSKTHHERKTPDQPIFP